MPTKHFVYIVKSRSTEEILAMGSSTSCAKTLGIRKSSFYTFVSKSKAGEGPYIIQYVDLKNRGSIENDLSPCHTCRDRTICNVSYCCSQWKNWYIERQRRIQKLFSQILHLIL